MIRSRTARVRMADASTTSTPSTATEIRVKSRAHLMGIHMVNVRSTFFPHRYGCSHHYIIKTSTEDNGIADIIVALEQNMNNDDLAMGGAPGAPSATGTTHRTCANALLHLM
ncbi:hypothetical protein ACEPAG_8414 [Sanghuangporus baumii]